MEVGWAWPGEGASHPCGPQELGEGLEAGISMADVMQAARGKKPQMVLP